MKRHVTRHAVILFIILATACTHAPSSLSPAGVVDFNQTRLIKGLDLFMDMAFAAEAVTPPRVSPLNATRIRDYHQVAVRTILKRDAGWQVQVFTGLEGVVATLAPAEQQTLEVYITLLKTLLQEVSQ
jgi:hypothetical protein